MRVVHHISSDCDIRVQRMDKDSIRIRITEKNSDTPADFELEGDTMHILDALSAVAGVLANLESLLKENPS